MSYVPIDEVHGDHLWNISLERAFANLDEVSFGLDDVAASLYVSPEYARVITLNMGEISSLLWTNDHEKDKKVIIL